MGWGAQGSKRDAGFKALKWPFKQKELTRTRERINDLVKTMSSGLRYDEAYVTWLSFESVLHQANR